MTLVFGASTAWAQGDGLTGNYYYGASAWTGTPYPPPPPPGSPEPGAATWTPLTTRIDATINFVDPNATAWAPQGSNVVVTWTGYVLTGTDAGVYTFYIRTDDGSRLWVTNPMAAGGELVNSWIGQGPTNYQGNANNLNPNTFYPIRYEYFQGGGGSQATLSWSSATMAEVVIPQSNLFSAANPKVCTPPTVLTATGGYDKAFLSWTAGTGQTSYTILRGTAPGGPYTTTVATGVMTTTYTDTTATHPGPYYYVVFGTNATGNSPYSNEATCTTLAPLISAAPLAVQVAENGGQATVTVTLLGPADTGTVSIPVSSADGTKLQVIYNGTQGNMATLSFSPGTMSQTFTVIGKDAGIGAPPPNYTVLVNFMTVTSTNAGSPYQNYNSTGQDLGPVTCTILPDAPGIIVNPPSVSITNGGPPVTFTVQLAANPTGGTVVLNLSVSDGSLAVVTPTPITTAGYNNPVTVTLTPIAVDPQTTYTGPFTISIDPSASTDPGYKALGATLVDVNMPVNLPPLTKVWGKCGLLGGEGLLPLLLAMALRRRKGRRGPVSPSRT
jgi:hypothetical protein